MSCSILAGFLHCNLGRNPKSLQHPGKNKVTLINLIGDLCPLLQKVSRYRNGP